MSPSQYDDIKNNSQDDPQPAVSSDIGSIEQLTELMLQEYRKLSETVVFMPVNGFDPDIPHITIEEYYNNIDEYRGSEIYIEGYVSTTLHERVGKFKSRHTEYYVSIVSEKEYISGETIHIQSERDHKEQKEWDDEIARISDGRFGVYIENMNYSQAYSLNPGDYIIIKGTTSSLSYFSSLIYIESLLDVANKWSSRYPK